MIDNEMTIDIKDLGIISRFNGLDVSQTKLYTKISNSSYIRKIINKHPSMFRDYKPCNIPIPISDDKTFIRSLESAIPPSTPAEQTKLQVEMEFNYRQAIGELIFAMTTCWPDIAFLLIKLSQYSQNPAKVHYQVVISIFQYLNETIDRGIYFWRKEPNDELPSKPLPIAYKQTHLPQHVTNDPSDTLVAMVDSDWAGDSSHRQSVTGMILKLGGGSILYKTKYQDTVALSSAEAEFAAACDTGKSILYVQSILTQLNLDQQEATILHIDNNGALLMGNAQQPTRRTKHVEVKKFALLDWVERDLLFMKRINTSDNCADGMTKPLGKTLHYWHFDYTMGYYKPDYANNNKSQANRLHSHTKSASVCNKKKVTFCSSEQGGDNIHSRH